MKGRMTRRFGGALKTKMVGGVSTKHHDNPHVMKRASGGRCAEAGGAVAAPSLSRPMRKMGGGVRSFANKNQGEMPKSSSSSDTKRVTEGMDGKEQNRAYGGVVQPKTFPGYPGKKAGPAASGGRGLKSPGSQSGTVKTAGMGSQSKNDGQVGSTKKDGTKNASGKTFASGGHVEKDKDDEEGDEEDDSSDDAADEDEALDKVEHEAEHHASGGKVKGFHPGGEKGKLHRELGISEDKKIPAKRLAKAERSKDPEIAHDAKRAETMKHWKH